MFAALLLILFVAFWLWTLLLQWAWNVVVFGMFHGPHITFWQAFAVTCLLSAVGGIFQSSVSRKST